MSRSGYVECDGDVESMLAVYGWSANVHRCIRGRKGQAFMWELYHALEALPRHVLIRGGLADENGDYCALGALARYRGLPIPTGFQITDESDPDEFEFQGAMGALFGVKQMLAREVMFYNDEADDWHPEPEPHPMGCCRSRRDTPEERWQRMRAWIVGQLRDIP